MSKPAEEPTDEALAARAQDGDVRALDLLIARHQAKVLRVLGFLGVRADDRDDVGQEVFVRVFRHLGSFKTGQSFGAWIYRVTVNASHDWRSRRGRIVRDEAPWEEDRDVRDERPRPDESVRDRELRRALEGAIGDLSERERGVFVLKELEGLSSADVARILGVTAITVRRHLFQARRRLRRLLEADEKKNALGVERLPEGGGNSR